MSETKDYKWACKNKNLSEFQKEDLCRRGYCKFAIPAVDVCGKPFQPWRCGKKDGKEAYPPVKECEDYIYDGE